MPNIYIMKVDKLEKLNEMEECGLVVVLRDRI